MRCHPEEEHEQPFGVLVALKLCGVRVAKVAERHLEERGPVQVLRHLKDKPRTRCTKNPVSGIQDNLTVQQPADPESKESCRRGQEM